MNHLIDADNGNDPRSPYYTKKEVEDNTKRYAATASFYVFAESLEEAKQKATQLCGEIDVNEDNKMTLTNIKERKWGIS